MGCLAPADFDSWAHTHSLDYRSDVNYRNQWGLGTINADRAYAHLELIRGDTHAPGTGVTLGFIDSGIDQTHPLFAGSTIDEVHLGRSDEIGDRFSHGTAVASVAAAPRIPRYTNAGHGVAWGADIAMFAIPTSGSGSPAYNPISLARLQTQDAGWAGIFRNALNWADGTRSVDFLNLSVGYEGIIDNYSETDLRARFGDTIAEMAQAGVADKTVLVWAAGNAHGDECTAGMDHCENGAINAVSVEILPGLVARIPELQGHTVSVVAVGENGQITDFSNRCGIAADWCLAAPGENILTAYFGPHEGQDAFQGLSTAKGTSFAAPMVTGGLAVMKHLFRDQLSNTDLLARLLDTAEDDGIYADSSVYGHGLLDLGAATSPVGVMGFTLGNRIENTGVPLQASQLQSGPAIGDGIALSLAGQEIAAFDALGAPFWFDLSDFSDIAAAPSMTVRLRDFLVPAPRIQGRPEPVTGFTFSDSGVRRTSKIERLRLGLLDASTGAREGHFALARHALALTYTGQSGLSATAFTTEGVFGQMPASGAALSWRPAGSPLALRAGWMGERESLLGSVAEGAFGSMAADAFFVGVEADKDISGWTVGANAEVGTVRTATRNGFVTAVSPLTTSTFALHASRALADEGTFRVSFSQPLRVEHGRASLTVPTGRTKAGDIVRSSIAASLVPSGRQIDIEAHWHQPLALGEWRLGAVWSHEPEHRATEDPEITLLSGWLYSF